MAFAVLAALCCWPLCAEQMSLQELGQTDGLGNLAVKSLAQDHDGAIWVGTENGLYRYDATRMVRVDTDKRLASIGALAAGSKGLWVGTGSDLWFWNGATLEPVRIEGRSLPVEYPQSIAATRDGAWVVSQGALYKVVRSETSGGWMADKTAVAPRNFREPHSEVSSVVVGANGDVWFGCGRAICRLHEGSIEQWDVGRGVPRDTWHYLLPASDGSLWARSNRHILQLRPGATGFVVRAVNDGDLVGLYPLAEDGQHRILSARRDGVLRWDGKSWERFGVASGLPADGRVTSILSDREGGLWFGMLGSGLLRWRGYGRVENWTTADGLPHSVVWAIARGAAPLGGPLAVATGAGVATWNDARRGFVLAPNTAGQETVSLALDAQNVLWAGTTAGKLLAVNSPRGRSPAEEEDAFNGYVIRRLLRNRAGQTWILVDGQLFQRPEQAGERHKAVPIPGATLDSYSDACLDGHDALWIANGRSVRRYVDGGWEPGTEVDTDVAHLACLADGTLVAGGYGGLRSIVPGAGRIAVNDITPASLQGREILALMEDSRGWLWVGTDAGVAIWNRRQWRILDQTGGLVWNDLSSSALYEDGDRTIWIGTSRGLSHVVEPGTLFEPSVRAPLIRSASHEGREISSEEKPVLPWDHAALHVALGLPSFRDYNRQMIESRLLGLDDNWEPTPRGEIWFSALPPGAYRFEARSIDRDLNVYSPVVGFDFVVAPPWWKTSWAMAGALVLLALAVFGGYRWRVRGLMERERRLEALVAERTRELEASREQLREQATKDSLTGVWNRRALLEILDRELTRAVREKRSLAVVMADVDHFKRVNDTYGHPTGDEVLREFAGRLVSWSRPYDAVCRYGGEEFVLVLPGLDLAREKDMARLHLLHSSISQSPIAGVAITCSFGAARFDPDTPQASLALIGAADAALYTAKHAGRNRVELALTPSIGGEPQAPAGDAA